MDKTDKQEILDKIEELSKKIEILSKQENKHYEYSKSFESKMKQWGMFYIASLLADETIGR